MLRVNEHFWSIQGEGIWAGATSIFIRLQGCPVGCPWCDSKLTWYAGGFSQEVDALLDDLATYPHADRMVITGGEPLVQNIDELILGIRRRFPSRVTHIETSGAYPFKGEERPDWVTISPKARAKWRLASNVLQIAGELKYVVDEEFDPEVVFKHLDQFVQIKRDEGPTPGLPGRFVTLPDVVLMPEGSPPRPEMVQRAIAMLAEFPGWRFGPRLQYAYPTISEGEGLNNKIVSVEFARERAREHRRDS